MEFIVKRFCDLTPAELYEILKARQRVFMLEQGIRCLDMDDKDYESLHVFAMEEGRVVANLRVFSSQEGVAHIGRVLTLSRKKGNGRALVKAAVKAAKEELGAKCITVDAQLQAAPFYKKCGFSAISDPFLEEEIEHIKMQMIPE